MTVQGLKLSNLSETTNDQCLITACTRVKKQLKIASNYFLVICESISALPFSLCVCVCFPMVISISTKFKKSTGIFLIFPQKKYTLYMYSLEALHLDAFNEFPQHRADDSDEMSCIISSET